MTKYACITVLHATQTKLDIHYSGRAGQGRGSFWGLTGPVNWLPHLLTLGIEATEGHSSSFWLGFTAQTPSFVYVGYSEGRVGMKSRQETSASREQQQDSP